MLNYDITLLKSEFDSHIKEFIKYFYNETKNSNIQLILNKESIHSLEYYWLTQEVKYHQISQMIDQSELESAFDEWNKSHYAQFYFQQVKEKSENEAHQDTLIFMRKDLDSFFSLQIEGFLLTPNESYQRRNEIGDTKKNLGSKIIANIPNTHLKISGIFKNTHIVKIQKAYKRIKELSPDSFERLNQFSHTIIPIIDKELVSFSNQDLPGFSSINLDHRDDIDLMDDLIHENGHHHLNYFLNTRELIIESDDELFFSPWRETLRPIRGIYHGYMTFFWAVLLYRDLLLNEKSEREFTSNEFLKIQDRLIEELALMKMCQEELQKAKHLITKDGLKLMEDVDREIDSIYFKYIDKISRKRFDYFQKRLRVLSGNLK